MTNIISDSISAFSGFLTDNEKQIKNFKSETLLLRFAYPCKTEFIKNNLDSILKSFSRSFYFEKPDEDFFFTALGESIVISENGDKRFAATDRALSNIKEKIYDNLSLIKSMRVPLFAGGMKFAVEHSDSVWADFNDSLWFIPEILFLKDKEEEFFIFNQSTAPHLSGTKLKHRLANILENVYKCTDPEVKSPPDIVKEEGNAPKDKKKWKLMINETLDKIADGDIRKIVLSRKIDLVLSKEVDLNAAVNCLRNRFSKCYIFIFHSNNSSFIGATPETLAKMSNGKIEFDALAGSAPRGSNDIEDSNIEKEILFNSKNISEHKFVVEHLKDSIKEYAGNILIDNKVRVRKLHNIQHLWTKISADLKPGVSIFSILKEIYPTPAICGTPKDAALSLTRKLEGHKRGMYSGITGWFNLEEEGEFVIAIRSAVTSGKKVAVFAGSGIVAGSDPAQEFDETELKLTPILSIFSK